MEENKHAATYSGISFVGVLFIVFLVLKLTHVIDWSWWWVTAPLWISAGLGLIFFVLVIIAIEVFNIFN